MTTEMCRAVWADETGNSRYSVWFYSQANAWQAGYGCISDTLLGIEFQSGQFEPTP